VSVRLTVGGSAQTPTVRVVCRDSAHSVTVATVQREDRWDGSGLHYWHNVARMTNRERARWVAADIADRSALPRAYRDGNRGGFEWLRNGEPVSDSDAYTIGQAAHHGARRARSGVPEPGTLRGVTRVFELPKCACGARGIRRVSAETVELILDDLHARKVEVVDLADFRDLIATHRHA
jgi:hypothetical protein